MPSGPDKNGIASGFFLERARDHHLDLLRVDADFRNRVLPTLKRVEREIVEELRRVDPTEPRRQSFRFRRLEAMLPEIRKIIRGGYGAMQSANNRRLESLAQIEAGWTTATLESATEEIGVSASFVRPTREQLLAITSNAIIDGTKLNDFWSNQRAGIVRKFRQEIQAGLTLGESIPNLVRRIRGGTKDGVIIPGVMKGQRRQIEALVRTSVGAVANDSRMATLRANSDIVSGVTHVSTLDNRTTMQCIARDGLSWTLDGKPIGGHSVPFEVPPIHVNCRSILAPLVAGAEEFEGERASMFGDVPANENFEQFMRRRERISPGFADQALGPERAQLWRDGKISVTDLLDFKGDPLTLEQLEQKIAA